MITTELTGQLDKGQLSRGIVGQEVYNIYYMSEIGAHYYRAERSTHVYGPEIQATIEIRVWTDSDIWHDLDRWIG